jgi:hypothetical protein
MVNIDSSYCFCHNILELKTSHMIIFPDKSPVQRYSPLGDVEIDKTGD